MKNISILLFLFPILLLGQLSPEKENLIKPLINLDYAESKHIGIGGNTSKIFERFDTIKQNLSNDDLYFLAKNSSNALRLYSSQEFVKRMDERIVELYQFYINYPIKISYMQGCIIRPVDLSELIYDEFKNTFELKITIEKLLENIDRKKIKENTPAHDWIIHLNEINILLENKTFNSNFEKIETIIPN